jgi:glycosyltransferase involved in cell wall biosynthesis
MKLLFTGPLKDFSGFATASRHFLQALNCNKALDVVARPLTYDQLDEGQRFEVPDWMAPLLQKDLQKVDMAIQMTTCNVEAVPVPGIPNGLYTFFETDRIQRSWAAKAQEFDFIMVPSRFNVQTLLNSGITKPILVVGPPCDGDVYDRQYQPFEIASAGNRTVFYNVCQLSTKKGIDTLLRAYYAAFAGVPDDVLLVLKTYVNMQNRANDLGILKQYIQAVKDRCRIPVNNLPPVLPLIYTMSDEEIHGLHTRGDAYVCSSRGEGWGIPVFDALAHGKTVISHAAGGLADFVAKENALVYGGMVSFFYDMPHSDPGLFTGVEQCFEPSPAELALTMQHFHLLRKGAQENTLNEQHQKEWEAVLQRRKNARSLGKQYDYRNVHGQIAEQLLVAFKSWQTTGAVQFQEPSLEESL